MGAACVLRREGVGVRCLSVVGPSERKGAAREHFERATRAGVRVEPFATARLEGVDLIVDAIFGTRFRVPTYDEAFLRPITAIQQMKEDGGPQVLAVDIPSGLDGSYGVMSGVHVIADRTVAMAAEKLGTFLSPPEFVGDVTVVDIGIDVSRHHVVVPGNADIAEILPTRRSTSHKRSTGSVAVVAGSDSMTGAAALVVQGAMRAGSGYVTLACTDRVSRVVQSRCPEALVRVATDGDHLGPSVLDEIGDVLDRAQVVAIGPGLGVGDDQRELVRRLLAGFDGSIVIDADGLNVLVDDPEILNSEKGNVVITPHPAELARLMDRDAHEIDLKRVDAAAEAVRRFGCCVTLKGFRSVIGIPGSGAVGWASPEEWDRAKDDPERSEDTRAFPLVDLFLNPTGGPELATAGTGDVLTGVTAAFIAANPSEDRSRAVVGASYVHGIAGSRAAASRSDSGVVAWDVAEALPEAVELIREVVS